MEGEVHEFRDDAVGAVAVLVRELVGALRWVEVGAEDEQALREVLVRLKLEEACAVVDAAPGPCAVLLVPLVGDPVREVAQIVLEGADEAVVRVVGQGAVQVRVEVRLHKVEWDVTRLLVVVALGREDVREPDSLVRVVARVDIAACGGGAPQCFGFSARYKGGAEGRKVGQVEVRNLAGACCCPRAPP